MTHPPLCIGLTGGIASGKSTVADLFAAHGIQVIDADLISHSLTQAGTVISQTIAKHFGPDVLQPNGSLNRAAIKTIIFNNPIERCWLEELLHPLIKKDMQTQIAQATSPYVLAVIPLLAESIAKGQHYPWLHRILVVNCPPAIQKERIAQRDHLDDATIQHIIQAQASSDERSAIADDIITNDAHINTLTEQVSHQHELYLKYASQLQKQ